MKPDVIVPLQTDFEILHHFLPSYNFVRAWYS
jgi:hypothetical protein